MQSRIRPNYIRARKTFSHRYITSPFIIIVVSHLEVGSIIFGDVGAVTLGQDHNLLLDVLDLILGFFEVNDLDGDDLLGSIVDAFEDLAEAAFADSLLFREYQLGVHLLQRNKQTVLSLL